MDYGKSKFITNRIKVYGIVQGVGFRPLVYHVAKKYGICGYVKNIGGYVEILAQAEEKQYQRFLSEVIKDRSTGCEIVRYEEEEICEAVCVEKQIPEAKQIVEEKQIAEEEQIAKGKDSNTLDKRYQDFIIVESESSEEISILPPDLPVCENCRKELVNDTDRRFLNPFISCTACGPRYTIIEELPYDRDNTTMRDFTMCEECSEEYLSTESRRHHAQTISCNDCGPYLIYRENHLTNNINPKKLIKPRNKLMTDTPKTAEVAPKEMYDREAFTYAVSILKAGGILAVKGIGGYHFVCSPFMEESVVNLRKLKGREEKPFAVMFETLESIKQYCTVSEEEEKLLYTKARPIVLLTMHKEALAPSTNKGSIYCGAFLPYTPLQQLLTKECGPLIMTSANQAGKPIIREDEVMLSLKSPYLHGVLYNQRRIVRSVDDSVAKVIDHKPQLIRRSRGYVPYPVFTGSFENNSDDVNVHEPAIFAAGGDLKAAYCLYRKGSAVVSQYFGDLEEETVLAEYENSLRDLSRLLKTVPDFAVCDLHPNYHSTRFTKTLGIPVLKVQHHHAHIASVMAEHSLTGPILGVSFDGTGYGEDGNIWGGEFLLCEQDEYKRVAQLRYTPMLGGDSSMRDAQKTAACYLIDSGLMEYSKDERLPIIKAALEHGVNTVLNSSMGRLFDAVASILGISQENRYEGECAAELEREAVYALRNQTEPAQLAFSIKEKDEIIEIDSKPVLEKLCQMSNETSAQALALGFHYAVADMIIQTCDLIRKQFGITAIALSGGVFQNTILTERTCKLLRANGFTVYYNLAVPPNDGGISLGQTYIGLLRSRNADRKAW